MGGDRAAEFIGFGGGFAEGAIGLDDWGERGLLNGKLAHFAVVYDDLGLLELGGNAIVLGRHFVETSQDAVWEGGGHGEEDRSRVLATADASCLASIRKREATDEHRSTQMKCEVPSYLCPSVFICGCFLVSRLRRTEGDSKNGKAPYDPPHG